MTVLLVLLLNRSALTSADDAAPSPTPPPVTALPPAQVSPPPTAAGCARLMSTLPAKLRDLLGRPVTPSSTQVAAWGEPPVVLRCGVPRPPGYVKGATLTGVNGVTWLVEPVGERNVWTTVDRPLFVELSVPGRYAGAPVAVLSPLVAKALPLTAVPPG